MRRVYASPFPDSLVGLKLTPDNLHVSRVRLSRIGHDLADTRSYRNIRSSRCLKDDLKKYDFFFPHTHTHKHVCVCVYKIKFPLNYITVLPRECIKS